MDSILKYFPDLSDQQHAQFQALDQLYVYWNERINVISRKDIAALYERHVLHSLGIAKIIDFTPGTAILDLGTGGGFPGIPLAILYPECSFTLVDSIAKKIKVVEEVASSLELKNVTPISARVEKITDKYDFVVTRAVTRIKPLTQWIQHKIKKEQTNKLANGVLALKGGDLSEEFKGVKRSYELYNLSDYFEEDFFETKKVVHLTIAH